MSRMKLIAILVVMAIPFSIGEYASAASTMTKTIEYSADRAEEKQDVSKVVEQDGKKWKLKKVDYKIIKKDPVMTKCQTAHCGRYIPHFDFSAKPSPIVPYRHLPQSLSGMTADCRSLV